MNLNKAIIVGRMVRDPEVKALPSGNNVASFSVATSRKFTANNEKKEEAEFHNIVAFGKLADIIGTYVKKGQLILIEGRIQTRSWEKDGKKNYRTEIVAEGMQMGPRPGGSAAAKEPQVEEGAYGPKDNQEAPPAGDIPF